jgi:alginate O-acetyltransferase complex protein AlgI
VPFRAPDFASTWRTLNLLVAIPDLQSVGAHPAIIAIPLLALAFCLVDRDRRVQNWLIEHAAFATAVGATVVAILALEIFGQVDAQIPFVYFQF